jgi:hypothetical protein
MRQPSNPAVVQCIRSGMEIPSLVLDTILGTPSAQPVDKLQQRQLLAIWRLREAYHKAAEGPLSLSDLLSRIASEIVAATDTVIIWADAIESIIQDVEALYGPAPGQGLRKAAQVKAAVLYMVKQEDQRIPRGKLLLAPGALEAVIDWGIDGLVLLLNRHQIWQLSQQERLQLSSWFRLRTRVAAILLNLLGVLYGLVAARAQMLPQVRRIAEDTIRKQGADLTSRVRNTFDFLLWCMENRQQLLGLLDLVSTAAMEAESFLQMPGSEKKRYARELVLLALQQEWSGWPATPLWTEVVGSLVDLGIDVVVRLFNKRDLFAHRSGAGQSDRPTIVGQ